VSSGERADSPQPRQPGEDSRARILSILTERQHAGLEAPTFPELCRASGFSETNVHHHLQWLEREGVVRLDVGFRPIARRVVILLQP